MIAKNLFLLFALTLLLLTVKEANRKLLESEVNGGRRENISRKN